MSESQTLLLGFIAGVTILIGLPLGRMRAPRPGVRQFLNALAIGILLFLIWDVLVHAFEPIDTALGRLHDGAAGIGPVLGYAALFFLGLTIGLMSLVYYEAWLAQPAEAAELRPGHDGAGRTGRGQARYRGLVRRPPHVAADRRRDRAAQLRRGPGHRRQRGRRRDRAGDSAGHRLRAAQRHRRIRHRGPAGRRR